MKIMIAVTILQGWCVFIAAATLADMLLTSYCEKHGKRN